MGHESYSGWNKNFTPNSNKNNKIPKNTLNMKGMGLCKENNKLLLSSIGQNTWIKCYMSAKEKA